MLNVKISKIISNPQEKNVPKWETLKEMTPAQHSQNNRGNVDLEERG